MAHPVGISVEGELGVLAGEEDEDTKSEFNIPHDLKILDQVFKDNNMI